MKRILIIQTAFLGDVVLATPLIEKLHQFYPGAELDFIVKKGNEQLLQDHPLLTNLYVLNKKNKYSSMWQLIKQVRQRKYDLVVNLHRFGSSGIITALSGAKITVGFDKNPFAFAYTKKVKHFIGDKQSYKHEVTRNLELIAPFTDNSFVRPKLYPSLEDEQYVAQYKTARYVCIAPCSVWFTKQLPQDKWILLIKGLPNGITIYLLGAPGDAEVCEAIKGTDKEHTIINLAGKLSLKQSCALMRDALLNYVNDSGPLHLASAGNAPVCALFCSTIPEFGFGPLSDFSRIVEIDYPLPCRPCNLHGYKKCPEGHFKCGNDIAVKKLLDAFEEVKRLVP